MKWIKTEIITSYEAIDSLSDLLLSLKASGVEIKDYDCINNTLIDDVSVCAYFPENTSKDELEDIIRARLENISQFLDTGKGEVYFTEVKDEDWENNWKKYFKPFKITKNIVIKPSWEKYSKTSDEIIIELDPGMAFGTGTHETTEMCARLLEETIKPGERGADIGCGTGILSIIAVKSGASKVYAVDNDSIAVKATVQNCLINGAEARTEILEGTISDIMDNNLDFIAANIIADVIIQIAPDIKRLLKNEGSFIASGIIKDRYDEVCNVYKDNGFEQLKKTEKGEWVAIRFICRDSLRIKKI